MAGRHTLLWLAIGIAVLVTLPLLVNSSFAMDVLIRILLFSFIGVAWNLMGRYAKQLTLGHAAYFGLGAYTTTLLQIEFDFPAGFVDAARGVHLI